MSDQIWTKSVRLKLSTLAVLSLLSLSTPALADPLSPTPLVQVAEADLPALAPSPRGR
ncbi:hypothetical protein ACN28I_17760 [Archangium gephyra]|uniref:hypothetical protein n=1 Tax=Archangium gephyra TaxID=48 RepID=UPI003B76408C